MRLLTPWTIHEAEIGLYAAWKDGLPMEGPGGRHKESALFSALGSVSITQSFAPGQSGIFDHTGSPRSGPGLYSISLDFKDGAVEDDLSRLMTRLHGGGYHVLVIRFRDEAGSGNWTKRQFFYVSLNRDSLSANAASRGDGAAVARQLDLQASWMVETVGSTSSPSAEPEVLGEVEWICGPHRIPCLTYDPATQTWAETNQNATTEALPPHAYLGELLGGEIGVSLMVPRLVDGETQWQAEVAVTVDGSTITPYGDYTLQQNGTPEPLLCVAQDRVLDEPLLVFRYLRKVYFSIGHNLICIPSVSGDAPPDTHEPNFRIGDLVFLPRGAFTDA